MATVHSNSAQAVKLELVASSDCLACQACFRRGELDRIPPTEVYGCPLGAGITEDSAFDLQTGELIASRAERPCGRPFWESASSGGLFSYLLTSPDE